MADDADGGPVKSKGWDALPNSVKESENLRIEANADHQGVDYDDADVETLVPRGNDSNK